MSTRVTGLEELKITESSFSRLGSREVLACVYLRSDDLTPAVRGLPPAKRFAYMAARADRWANGLRRRHPGLTLEKGNSQSSASGPRRPYEFPRSLSFRGTASELLAIAGSAGVRSVQVVNVAGYHRRRSRNAKLEWYCVRALVVIRVEHERSGLQNTEDRFVLVRASSFEDAKKRLRNEWREYAAPYLNSDGRMVSWSLEKVIDVYRTGEASIDPAGTEVYSKPGARRMRPEYVWCPKLARPRKMTNRAD